MAGILAGVVASQMGGLFQVGQTILGTIHAPLLGLFILGRFSVSLLFNLWVTIGAMLYGRATPYLEFSDEGCNATTPFDLTTTTPPGLDDHGGTEVTSSTDPQEPGDDYVFPLYLVSYTLYSLFGVSVTFFVGMIVSLFTKPWTADRSGKIYVHPTFYKLMKMWEERRPGEDPAASTKDLVSLEKF
ncbi:sodium-dependent multivitamin transporter-like [Penaeus monodon]|uniref:sodium-dependent multivitamin transporter-like n=1 Tax=Penaeus monodon TaxID=6687 RepID=UPI0018A72610|nr:sodium-dependent multivitamin transporter-like [Penaeus monodon]